MSEVSAAGGLSTLSDIANGRQRRDVAGLLSGVELFAGIGDHDLRRLASLFSRLELAPGETLWRHGEACKGLAVLLAGEVQVCRQLPGERELELARLGAGELMGEISLLGGGAHSATVRCADACSLLLLTRAGFEACTTSFEPSAHELRRRIVAIVCGRLRRAFAALVAAQERSASLGDVPRVNPDQREPQAITAPPLEYVSRLPLFRTLEPDLVAELVGRGTVMAANRGQVIQPEGTQPGSCYITLNGVVEDVVHRRRVPLRVGFAGPGHAFGYLGLLDGEPAPATSVTRERTVLLSVDREHVEELLGAGGPLARPFAAALEGGLVANLETAERTLSHLATRTAS